MRWTLILAEPGQAPAPPWHDPAAVARHITATLPGTEFGADGVARFVRRSYTITFRLTADEPGIIDVEATEAAAESAVVRVAQKAGWALLDEHGHAAGAVPAPPPADAAARRFEAPPALSGSLLKAGLGLAAALAIAVAAGVRWSQLQADLPAAAAGTAAAAAAPAAAPTPAPAGPRGRMIERFRDHPIALQLVTYVEASVIFQKQHGRDAWINPAALAWPIRFSGQLDAAVDPFLPASFRSPVRDGYRFTFEGRRCAGDPREGPGGFVQALEVERCRDAVYTAQPLALGQPSFAFHSGDWRLRFREDSVPPGPGDPVVAHLDPLAPDPPPTAPVARAAAAAPPPELGAMWDAWERAIGATRPATSLAATAQERPVESDLRALRAAQRLYALRVGRGHYTGLERLMTPAVVGDATLPAMLPAAFAEPERHGYRFEFSGTPISDDWTKGQGKAMGPHFELFRYVATPIDLAGRTLAIYTDGAIRVATGRVPAPTDPMLLASQ